MTNTDFFDWEVLQFKIKELVDCFAFILNVTQKMHDKLKYS